MNRKTLVSAVLSIGWWLISTNCSGSPGKWIRELYVHASIQETVKWKGLDKICEDAVHWLQFGIQYHHPLQTRLEARRPGTKHPPMQMDLRLPDGEATGGENRWPHLIHSRRWLWTIGDGRRRSMHPYASTDPKWKRSAASGSSGWTSALISPGLLSRTRWWKRPGNASYSWGDWRSLAWTH